MATDDRSSPASDARCGTEVTLGAVLRKARFWEKYARVQVNDRQRDVINRLLDGVTEKLTTTKWATLENARTTPRSEICGASSSRISCGKTRVVAGARAIRWLMRER